MKNKFYFFLSLSLTILLFSCPDDESGLVSIPEVDRTIQQVVDDSILNNYLETHYYNAGQLSQMADFTINDIIITKLDESGVLPDPEINTMLIDDVITGSTVHEDAEYDYYYLNLNQGGGVDSPNFSDKVRVNYQGNLLDGEVFDNTNTPVVFDLTAVVAAWGRIIPEFNTAEDFSINSDGTINYTNPGIGVMFIPSGLAYYAVYQTGIPSYSNLVFKFELMQTESNDHDSDNIPSYMEVSDSNEYDLYGFDTDDDIAPNFLDIDDDADGTITSEEIQIEAYSDTTLSGLQTTLNTIDLLSNQFLSSISSANGTFNANVITLVDSNQNGIPNYLDATESDIIE